jgi:hypothetical protein
MASAAAAAASIEARLCEATISSARPRATSGRTAATAASYAALVAVADGCVGSGWPSAAARARSEARYAPRTGLAPRVQLRKEGNV